MNAKIIFLAFASTTAVSVALGGLHKKESSICLTAPQRSPTITAAAYKKAWSYSLKDSKTKKTVKIDDLKGKYKAIYIDAFASWCGPCQMAIPEVIKLHAALKDKKVLFIGLNMADMWADMAKNISEKKIPYTVLHDPAERSAPGIGGLLGIEGIPTVLILDGKTLAEKGRWVGYDEGYSKAELSKLKSLGVSVK